MSMEARYVVGIGEALWDVFPGDEERLGGAPVIFAYHAAQSGFRGVVISAVGEGGKGDKLIRTMEAMSLDVRCNRVEGLETGQAIVSYNSQNRPEYKIIKSAAWTRIGYQPEYNSIAQQCGAVYFGPLADYCGKGYNRHVVESFLSSVPKKCYKVFDVNLRRNGEELLYDDNSLKWGVKICNVLKANQEEIWELEMSLGLTHHKRERELCRKIMRKYDIAILLLTKGKEGSTVYWKERGAGIRIFSSEIQMKVKDSVGAGDAFAGAYIGSLLSGRSYLTAYDIAAKRARWVCGEGVSMPHIVHKGVFFSYATADGGIISFFQDSLKNEGIKVWRDVYELKAGAHHPSLIRAAIQDCRVFVFFLSKHSKHSEFVMDEVQYALDCRKTIITVILDDSLPHYKSKGGISLSEKCYRNLKTASINSIINDIIDEYNKKE